jgi:hypothetical protein
LDGQIIAEKGLPDRFHTGFADQRIALSALIPGKQDAFQPFSSDHSAPFSRRMNDAE